MKAIVLSLLLLTGCSALTIAPKEVSATQIGFSGNVQNGGLLDDGKPLPNGSRHIDAEAYQRYVKLLEDGWAKGLVPVVPSPLQGISQLSDGTYAIDSERLVLFIQMNKAFHSATDGK